ncbi:MAG TPA: tetratricopeptide repeat protein [Candidatus Obscuribacterales bacterium]
MFCKRMGILFAALVISGLDCFSIANPPRDEALVHYTAGDFKKARTLLEESLKKFPNQAETHYHLANTLVKLEELQQAIAQYKQALALKPRPVLERYCTQGIERCEESLKLRGQIAAQSAAKQAEEARAAEKTEAAKKLQEQALELRQKREKEINDRKDRISAAAEEEIKRLKEQKAQKLYDLEDPDNYRRSYRIWLRGAREQINREYDQQIDRVRKDTERRLNSLQSLKDDNLVESLNSQLKADPSRHHLDPVGSTIYLRKYKTGK